MAQVWRPEQVVSAALARSLVEAQFPDLRGLDIEPFGVGWDNTAYLVDGRIVFRFPRRAVAVELIETEARVLPRIAGALPLPVPVPRWPGRPDQGYPWPFAGYELLPGTVASDANLDAAARLQSAPVLGRFLAALHAIDPAGLEAPGDTLGRADMGRRLEMTRERIDALVARGLVADPLPLLRLLERSPTRPPAAEPRLCHGDLYVRHLLVTGGGRLCGVIDWGDVHVGQPAVDLAIAHSFLPPAARPAFLEAYGPVDPGAWAFARLRALFHAVVLMLYAHEEDDAALLREAGTLLENVLADP
jgi:aminoglycoside phosphotransferase (APT) family kinase protein